MNLGLKCKMNKFRNPTFTFLSSSSSPGDGSLFTAAAFRVSVSFLGVAVGVLVSFSLPAYQFSFLSVQALFSVL